MKINAPFVTAGKYLVEMPADVRSDCDRGVRNAGKNLVVVKRGADKIEVLDGAIEHQSVRFVVLTMYNAWNMTS